LFHIVFGIVAGCDESIASRKRFRLCVSGFERKDNLASNRFQRKILKYFGRTTRTAWRNFFLNHKFLTETSRSNVADGKAAPK
jgi:hypothetical protein